MKTIKRTVLLTLIASVSLLFSCAKDGKDGLPGPAGPAGNANVKSTLITVYTSDWSGGGNGYSVSKYVPIITQDIVDGGVVMCYESDGSNYIALPTSVWLGSYTRHALFAYSTNNIEIIYQDDDGLSPNPGMITFKVVAIASSARLANPSVDYTNYEEVKATFNLKD